MTEPKVETKNYKQIRKLRHGELGQTLLVESQTDGSLNVLKQTNTSKMTSQEKQTAFNESKHLETLSHPYLIKVKEVYKEQNKLCLIMDYADGGNLSSKIEGQGNKYFSETQILDWFIQICLGLRYLHNRWIVHGHFNCESIFLTSENIIKIGDLCIERALSKRKDKTRCKLNSLSYFAPEIFNDKPYTFESDIWALGVILYELCALKPPFEGYNIVSIARKALKGEYSPLPQPFSDEMKNLVATILQVDPSKRPTISKILSLPFVQKRIMPMLNELIEVKNAIHYHKSGEDDSTKEIFGYSFPYIPEDYICPITQELLQDPVVAADGHTYERQAIVHWLESGHTSPITRETLNHKSLVSNHRLKSIIQSFQEKCPDIIQRSRRWKAHLEDIKKLREELIAEYIEKSQQALVKKQKENEELKKTVLELQRKLQQNSQANSQRQNLQGADSYNILAPQASLALVSLDNSHNIPLNQMRNGLSSADSTPKSEFQNGKDNRPRNVFYSVDKKITPDNKQTQLNNKAKLPVQNEVYFQGINRTYLMSKIEKLKLKMNGKENCILKMNLKEKLNKRPESGRRANEGLLKNK